MEGPKTLPEEPPGGVFVQTVVGGKGALPGVRNSYALEGHETFISWQNQQ